MTNQEILYATLQCVPIGCEITSPLRLAFDGIDIICIKDDDGKDHHPGGWPWAQRIGKPWQKDLEVMIEAYHHAQFVGAGL